MEYKNSTEDLSLTVRITYAITGTVQGVGFRPAVYREASTSGLGGWIQNRSGTVHLCLEGTPEKLGEFITSLHSRIPQEASIEHITQLNKEVISDSDISDFKIIESEMSETSEILIPPDLAMCKECESEILNCENRRFAYPFTTCVDCGPRYTVVNNLPYDRERTTLADFPLCKKCLKEYENSSDRRFHAESTACPECGPVITLLKTPPWQLPATGQALSNIETLKQTRAEIAKGKITAVRGIGGFLLVADAFNINTIKKLRESKKRPSKPFAVMFRNIETLLKYCIFNPEAVKLLISKQSPIVILDAKHQVSIENGKSSSSVSYPLLPMNLISPDSYTIGAMVPYSPMHKLLFESIADDPIRSFDALIMTSGNRGGEPICITNSEAFERLGKIADCFLVHNREINLRNDDSICVIQFGKPQIWRRARGFAPTPIKINYVKNDSSVLAMGAELKNSIALRYDNHVVLSPHIGDLETPEAVAGLEKVIECFPQFLRRSPDIIAVDLHPDMQSTRLGERIAADLSKQSGNSKKHLLTIQHHCAHAASCMAEHNLTKAVALVFDGTGLGTDGTIWGAECFAVDFEKLSLKSDNSNFTAEDTAELINNAFLRKATFESVPLPGGDSAVYNPLRQLVARYSYAGLSYDEIMKRICSFKTFTEKEVQLWLKQCEKKINSPLSHAAGRLFDAVSIMLHTAPEKVTYEGESAIALEGAAKLAKSTRDFTISFSERTENGMLIINWNDLFAEFADLKINAASSDISSFALAFHHAVADAAVRMVEYANITQNFDNVVLTGGVFMNRILTELVSVKLAESDFNVYIHQRIPPNDGGIAFGQAVIASAMIDNSLA